MKTDERDILTREIIVKKLWSTLKFSIVSTMVMYVLTGSIIAFLAWGMTLVALPYQIGSVIAILFFAFLDIYYGYYLIKKLILFRQGKYRIVEDRVLRTSENEVRYLSLKEKLLRGRRYRHVEEDVIYFRDTGRVVVTGSTCRCTFVDDLFYIVKYEGEEEAVLIYNQREYRLEEEN